MKRFFFLTLLSFASTQVLANPLNECRCNPFPGNYPGAGLVMTSKISGSQSGTVVKLYAAEFPLTNETLEAALSKCRSELLALVDLEICTEDKN